MGINPAYLYKSMWGGLPFSKERREQQAQKDLDKSQQSPETPTGNEAEVKPLLELEWIKLRQLGLAGYAEAKRSNFIRVVTEYPIIPFGVSVSVGASAYGVWCFRRGLERRARIISQGLTVVVILAGVVIGGTREAERRLQEMEIKKDPPEA